MARKYEADSIVSIKNDRDRVRKRPSMFIPSTHKDGAIHIIFEIVDNSIDELSVDEPMGDTLTVTFDTKTREITIIDDGSGIPHEALLDSYTVLNTSGKFDNDDTTAYTNSGGTFGVGAKCAVFLSKSCEVTSMRNGKSLTYQFTDGLLTGTAEGTTDQHGTITRFTIDNRIIEADDVTPDDIRERLYEKSFLFPAVKMNLVILQNGKETKTYTYTGNTLLDVVKKMKPDTDIVRVEDTRKVKVLKNITDDDITEEKVVIDVALAYKEDALDADTDTYILSYANSIKTYDGGKHVEGLKDGVIKFFRDVVIPKASRKDKDLQITPTDMTSGLCAFVSVKLHQPEFSAQHKSRLSNQEVKFAVRDAVYDALCQQKNAVINQFAEFVRRVARGRLASRKTRKKDVESAFSKDRLEKLTRIVYNMETDEPELILVEGDSAANNAAQARDPHNQAIYPVKKPKNVYDCTSEYITKVRTVFNDIMDICGIEPGKKCDPSKSAMKRILMLTDGDVDGDDIAISTVCLLAKHCRPMLDAGMVGRILPPAYSFASGRGDRRKYVRSKRELLEEVTQSFVKEATIEFKGKKMTKRQIEDFIDLNFQYDIALEKLASRACCEERLMEYIAWKYHGTPREQKRSYWQTAMRKYSDLRVLMEEGSVVVDGELPGYGFINICFDDYFDRHLQKFKKIQSANSDIYGFTLSGKEDQSVYDIMKALRKHMPRDIKRFKGLGELDPQELKDLCMDKEKRTVVIFKFKDFEGDMNKIDIIMSTRAEFVAARSRIMAKLRLEEEDLDT